MARPKKQATSSAKPDWTPTPWSCRHTPELSEILAIVGPDGRQQVIAEVFNLHGIDAQANAKCIVMAVNQNKQVFELIIEMMDAIAMLQKCSCQTWEAEQAAELVNLKAKCWLEGKLKDPYTGDKNLIKIRLQNVKPL